MQTRKLFGVVLVSLLALTGCATQPTMIIKHDPVLPPDALLIDCPVEAPPAIKAYLALPDWQAKEATLIQKLTTQTNNIGGCNVQIKALRDWKAQQQTAVQESNKK